VLALLVPIQEPLASIRFIHVVDVSFDVLQFGIEQSQDTQTLNANPDLVSKLSSLTLALKERDEIHQRDLGSLADLLEFDKIEPPLARLVFAHERLMPPELLRHVHLE
jgi:hypothetical protein